MSAPARRAPDGGNVLVVGMHRSGTSVTTRVIHGMGLATCIPDDLFTNPRGNETGHWESTTLTGLNDDLLREIDSAWWCPPPVSDHNRIAPALAARGGAAALALKTTHPDAPWVWKDPRNCVLLPFWRDVLDAPPVVVLALRNPYDICRSLERRNHFPVDWSLALIERHLGHALRGLAGLPVICTRYESLVQAPDAWVARVGRQLADLGVAVSVPDAGQVRAMVEPSLQHGGGSGGPADLPLADEQRELIEVAFGLDEVHERFPELDLPGDSAAARSGLSEATRHLPSRSATVVSAGSAAPPRVPDVCVVVSLGAGAGAGAGAGGIGREQSVLSIVATTPRGGEVRLVGPGADELAQRLSGVVGDVIDLGAVDEPTARPETLQAICAQSAANHIVFTSDAVEPHPGWAEALGAVLSDPIIGAAGPILRPSSSGIGVQGLEITDGALNARWVEGVPPDVRDVPLLTRHLLAVRRATLAEVGGIDGLMSPSHGVWDWELCVRLWRGGYRIVAAPQAVATVRFELDAVPSDLAFRRNLLRFAGLHLDRGALGDVVRSLDGAPEVASLIHDALSDDIGRTRDRYRHTLARDLDEATNHVLTAGRPDVT